MALDRTVTRNDGTMTDMAAADELSLFSEEKYM
jgi:hypothetical protein